MNYNEFYRIANNLEDAGLIWVPEIGDEVSRRGKPEAISILVDPEGMSPDKLRSAYLWLPSVEQLVEQFEARQAILFHAGLELTEQQLAYKAIIQSQIGIIEVIAKSLRDALALSLLDLLLAKGDAVH